MALLKVLGDIVRHPLNRGRRLAALAGFVRWQVASRLAPGDIVFPWVNGSRFLVRTGDNGLTGNVYSGFQEFPEMGFLLHLLRRDDLFVDVGANAGSYTILACAALGARGICLEPIPATYRRLLDNIRINHLEARVECLNSGAGREPGTLRFSSALDVGNRVMATGEERADAIMVPMDTLDRLLAGRAPTLIKIDVEGYEMAVLEGAMQTLAATTLQAVIMEVNGSGAIYGFDEASLLARMQGLGFAACQYDPLQRALTLLPVGLRPDNILFVRDVERVRSLLAQAPTVTVLGTPL
ncbi:MAG: FkbM family methyltransferase [Pseudomonadota bacterium]|nr:FkbM family methyltransferase [Pseudomonadota bacterium]